MRNGQNNKRMRGRNRKAQNPMSRVYESNGPDVKIRGTPSHIAEKYIQLARDSQTSGDPISAENYYQHAEHYLRLIAAAQEQFRIANPQFYRPEAEARDDSFEEGDEEDMGGQQPGVAGGEPAFGTRDPQPYLPRDAQPYPHQQTQPPYPPQHQPQHHPAQHHQPQHHNQQHGSNRSQPSGGHAGDVERLPSFITGGGSQPQHQAQPPQPPHQGGNGHDNQNDRFPLHRRRRRHRGPRPDGPGAPQGGDGDESSSRE
jgi:hypothetical protein